MAEIFLLSKINSLKDKGENHDSLYGPQWLCVVLVMSFVLFINRDFFASVVIGFFSLYEKV